MVALIIAGGVLLVGGLVGWLVVRSNMQTDGSQVAAGSVCGDELIDRYVETVYSQQTRQTYAEALQTIASEVRGKKNYEKDINCAYISYEAYAYADDATGARAAFTTFSDLDATQDLSPKVTSFNSVDSMRLVVEGLEWNETVQGSEEEGSDGAG